MTVRMKNPCPKFVCLFCLAVMITCLPCPGRQSPEKRGFDAEKWSTYYYLHPEPNPTVEVILALSAQGSFDKEEAQPPLVAFFSQLFAQNPHSLRSWFSNLDKLLELHKEVLWTALWYSATPQATEQLKVEARRASDETRNKILRLISTAPPSSLRLEINSPSILDMLWSSFMATGDERYVNRIITTLIWLNEKKNLMKLMIGQAAKWSLTSNCVQHKKVLEICKAQLSKQDDKTVSILKEVIKQAEAKKR